MSMNMRNQEIIRTKGIIIEDSAGRDRILIGSPIPVSPTRVRDDTAKVRKAWAALMGGDRYMGWYKSYSNEANGIVFLNENGFDKVIIGEKTPDPNIGTRIAKSSGIVINDDQGFERSGYGILKMEDGRYRVNIGMDDASGIEAAHLFVDEDGNRGLKINYTGGQVLLTNAKAGSSLSPTNGNFSGIMVTDSTGKVLFQDNFLKKK